MTAGYNAADINGRTDGLLWSIWRFCKSPTGIITISFLLSRYIYLIVLHVTFNAYTLGNFWQFIDPKLLQHDLWNSLYYLHYQPPLFNAFLGIVLKLYPSNYNLAFQYAYLLMGYAFSIVLYKLMLRMRISPDLSLILAIIHTIHPATILYENWLFYAYPVSLFISISALLLCKFLDTKKSGDGIAFFSFMALLVYLNNFFSLWWFLFCTGIILYFCKCNRRIIIICAMVPLLLVVALFAKQEILFGRIQIGQYFLNESAYRRLIQYTPHQVKKSLITSGTVPAWCLNPPEEVISSFAPYIGRFPKTGIAVLDQEKKSSGIINFNNIGYLKQYDICMPAYLRFIRQYPKVYLDSFYGVIAEYFFPASNDHDYLYGPYYKGNLKLFTEYVNHILAGQFNNRQVGWNLVLAFPLLIIAGCIMAYSAYRRGLIPQSVTTIYMLFNILYVSAIAILIPYCEQNRYRIYIDPFYLVLLGMCLTSIKNFKDKASSYPIARLGE